MRQMLAAFRLWLALVESSQDLGDIEVSHAGMALHDHHLLNSGLKMGRKTKAPLIAPWANSNVCSGCGWVSRSCPNSRCTIRCPEEGGEGKDRAARVNPGPPVNPEIAKRTRVSAFESGPCPKTARYPSRTEVDEPPSVRRQDRSTVLTVENVGRFFPTGIDRIEEVFANGAPRAVAAPGAQTQNRIVVVERIIRDGAARCLEGRRLLKFFTHSTEKGRPVSRPFFFAVALQRDRA